MNVISEDKNKNINYRAWFLVILKRLETKKQFHALSEKHNPEKRKK